MTAPQNRIPELSPATLNAEQQSVIEAVASARGRIPTPYKIWIHSPELARHMKALGAFLSASTSLSKREIEIAVLFLAQRWKADYMFTVHACEARKAGLSDAVIDALQHDRPPLVTDTREQAVHALMAALVEPGTPSNTIFAACVDTLGHAGVAELLALCGYFTSVGLAMKLYGVSAPAG